MSAIYYYGQDGEIADQNLIKIFGLGTRELRHSDKLDADVFDVVGFVYKDNKILVVFPKHYYSKADIDRFNQSGISLSYDIKLLYNVIKKYGETENTNAVARSYLGAKDGYSADYPFKPFYEVYDYFQKYGIYKEKEIRIIEGTSGRVSWKDTIRKSNKIISGGNLVFSPFYTYKKNYNDVFLTECMAFIIDYTIDFFSDFLTMKKTGVRYYFDFPNNIDYVIRQLNLHQSRMFKDTQKHLVKSMIEFFEQFKGKSKGGKVHVKIRYFDMIWQCMISKYLNRHFAGIDPCNGAAVFDEGLSNSVISFSQKRFTDIDLSHNNFYIDVDHIAYEDDVLYIFDSKYYSAINDLNYKQLSYNEILRYHYPGVVEIDNILILPGTDGADLHFAYAPDYVGTRTIGTKIIEQFIMPKKVMEDYLLSN